MSQMPFPPPGGPGPPPQPAPMPEPGPAPVTPPEPQIMQIMPPPPNLAEVEDAELVRGIRVGKKLDDRVRRFLQSEIERALEYHKPMRQKIRKARERYAEKRKPKVWPWKGASNVEVPLIRPDIDQVHGRTVRVADSADPQFVVEPGMDREVPVAEMQAVEAYLQAELSRPHLRWRKKRNHLIHEALLVGAGFAKVYWDSIDRETSRFKQVPVYGEEEDELLEPFIDLTGQPAVDDLGNPIMRQRTRTAIVQETETVYEGNVIDVIRAEDMLWPLEADLCMDFLQDAHWIAQRYTARLADLMLDAGTEEDVVNGEATYRKKVLEELEHEADQSDQGEWSSRYVQRAVSDGVGVVSPPELEDANELELYEVWCRFRVEPKEPERECVFVYSLKHDKLLSARYNFFFHGRRPFVRAPFLETGEAMPPGLAARLEYTQQISNALTNSSLDALALANRPVLLADKSHSLNRGKQDWVSPGRVITSEDPSKVKPLVIGDMSPGALQMLGHIDRMGQKASGVTDFLVGMEGPKGENQTAQAASQRAGNVSAVFDVFLDNVRCALEELADLMFWNCWQFKPEGGEYQHQTPGGEFISVLFRMHPEAGGRYRFRIKASSIAANPEIRKQTLQHLTGMLIPEIQGLMEVVGQLHDPNLTGLQREYLMAMGRVKTQLLKDTARAHDLPGAGGVIPDWDQIWSQHGQEIEQRTQQAKQQPPPLDDTLFRKMGPIWRELEPASQIDVLQRAGIKPGPRLLEAARSAEARSDPQAQGPMGRPGGGGPPQPPGFPPQA